MGNDGGYLPAGIGWYRKSFTAAPNQNKSLSLYFEGVYMNAEVFLNGQSLGIRPYGYSTFFYDITPHVKPGQNTVAVRVDNSQQKNCRWYSGSGIYRHVWLISTDKVHFEQWGTAITTPEVNTKQATVTIAANVQNETRTPQNVKVLVELFDRKNKAVCKAELSLEIPANSVRQFLQSITVKNPALWSPGSPAMYRAELSVTGNKLSDNISIPFGIRKIEYSAGKGFVLNGQHLEISGGCAHHDNGPLGAAAYDRAEYKKPNCLRQRGLMR